MTGDTKTCKKTLYNPLPPHQTSPAPESRHEKSSPSFPPICNLLVKLITKANKPLTTLSGWTNATTALEDISCTLAWQQETTAATRRRKGHEDSQLLSQIPHVPEKLQCPNPDQPCRGTKVPLHRSGCHLPSFQASFETSQC